MHRIDTATRATDLFGVGKDGFRNGNKALGIIATQVDDAYLNDLQENVAQVIEAAGIALVKNDYTQLASAIQLLINRGGIKLPVRLATTTNIANLAAGAPNTLDGVALAANDRILVKGQATASQNGLYVVTTVGTGANGTWTRATDADGVGEMYAGMLVVVAEGVSNADSIWELTTDGAVTVGTTSLAFARKEGGRRRLTTNITLYVATTGSDSNDGLTAGTPFLTIQKAWNTLQAGYDLNGYSATIQLADGTYAAGLNAQGSIVGQVSSSSVVLNGNAGSPANVLINTGASGCVQASAWGGVTVQNLKVQSTANALQANAGGIITGGNGLIFGTVAAGFAHIVATGNGVVNMGSSYTISAGAGYHFYASLGGVITLASGLTVTLSGAPAFSSFFAIAQDASRIFPVGATFSGGATGTRYSVISNGVINTNGAGASFLPGSVAGTTATGGQYV